MVIWDRESAFRYLFEAAADAALKEIGFGGKMRAALIALPQSEDDALVILDGSSARKLHRADPVFPHVNLADIEAKVGSVDGLEPAVRPDNKYSVVLEENLNSRQKSVPWYFFVAPQSATVGKYFVYAALAAPAVAIDRVPQLCRTTSSGAVIASSLVSGLIRQLLHRAWLFLSADPDGYGIHSLSIQRFELARAAAANLVADALDPSGLHGRRDSDMLLSSISSLPYEGRVGQGVITVANPELRSIKVHLHLLSPVSMERRHAIRKLMEVTTESKVLLLHQAEVYGVGEIDTSVQESAELTRIDFVGRGSWQLRQGDRVILEVKDGIARLPIAADLDVSGIVDRVSWLLPGADIDALLRLARAARHNRHGAMLIIAANAAEEALRLAPQAWAVHPASIDDETMTQLTEMDGAVLVDPEGRCHAIGVILDGVASGMGDPARGSRYNNPIRYLGTQRATSEGISSAVVVVYSTDGSIDILPSYPSRVERALVEHLVSRLHHLAGVSTLGDHGLEDLSTTLRVLREHKFYLSARQCDAVNDALDRLAQAVTEVAVKEMFIPKFEADPRMDEERFLS
ncbi:hypothetical protein O3597_14720 [Verrucosispora sp. WMMA2044]|uniref:hypothetical protein n=1 Tax=Verrucosispora sp. WMMA2044 TaxID=3016419 RepID=UPI00248B4382|nr:hypothetical protein [Verrucosispora sp. WMMA2044]WBB46461.1 hypothetical protein O3597_14720 [Verrucosispora sp. WMMA2044]